MWETFLYFKTGVNKCCSIIISLFCLAIDWIIKRMDISLGVKSRIRSWIFLKSLGDLDIADDIFTTGIQPQTDKTENEKLARIAAKVGLQINNDKPRQYKTTAKQQSQSDQNSHIWGRGQGDKTWKHRG